MKNKYPIYVISKGRSKSCLTANELKKMGVDFTLVVEPQEFDDYKHITDNILTLPFSNLNQGSIPARNWVWEHSISEGHKKHWILDDNIESFNRLNLNKRYRVLSSVFFRCMEDFTDRYTNVMLSGPNYFNFCRMDSNNPAFKINTRVYSCILINNELPFRWRGKYNEDTDLSLRVLKAGYCTILFNAFLISKVTTMRMKGGNTDAVYADTDNRLEFAKSLQEQHPDLVKVIWRFNRWHHYVNYKPFAKNNKLIRRDDIVIPDGVDNYGMKLVDFNVPE